MPRARSQPDQPDCGGTGLPGLDGRPSGQRDRCQVCKRAVRVTVAGVLVAHPAGSWASLKVKRTCMSCLNHYPFASMSTATSTLCRCCAGECHLCRAGVVRVRARSRNR